MAGEPIQILLVEDNPGDVILVKEIFKEGRIANSIHSAGDGVEALAFLRKEGKYKNEPRPDIILLDVNLPKMNGHEVLKAIRADDKLKTLPVIMLTTSDSDRDILAGYENHVNAYLTKPVNVDAFIEVINAIEMFWFTIVKLPPKHD